MSCNCNKSDWKPGCGHEILSFLSNGFLIECTQCKLRWMAGEWEAMQIMGNQETIKRACTNPTGLRIKNG